MFNFISRKNKKNNSKDYKQASVEIPMTFYTNANGETCFRETVGGEYKIDRNGNVVRYR